MAITKNKNTISLLIDEEAKEVLKISTQHLINDINYYDDSAKLILTDKQFDIDFKILNNWANSDNHEEEFPIGKVHPCLVSAIEWLVDVGEVV